MKLALVLVYHPKVTKKKNKAKKGPIWSHFDLETPEHPDEPVCKKCKTVFSINTGVSSLRRHLSGHNIIVPAKRQTTLRFPITDPYNEEEQKKEIKN